MEISSDMPFEQDFRRRLESRELFIKILCELMAAEIAFPFMEGLRAYESELYYSSALCFLTGIENSIRITLEQLEKPKMVDELSSKTLSNSLLKTAIDKGLPVELLKMPGEVWTKNKLDCNKRWCYVEIVKIRNNLCHGNNILFQQSLPWEEGEEGLQLEGVRILTSECFKEISYALYELVKSYLPALRRFRQEKLG